MTYTIYDTHTRTTKGIYKNVRTARSKADKLDNIYGAYRYKVIKR